MSVKTPDHTISAGVNAKGFETVASVIPDRQLVECATYTWAPSGSILATLALVFCPPTFAISRLRQTMGVGRTRLLIDQSKVDSPRFGANACSLIRKHFFPGYCQTAKIQQWLFAVARKLSRAGGNLPLSVSSSIPRDFAAWNCWPCGSCRLMFCQEVRNNARS